MDLKIRKFSVRRGGTFIMLNAETCYSYPFQGGAIAHVSRMHKINKFDASFTDLLENRVV